MFSRSEDARLIEDAANGDAVAFHTLYHRYRNSVFGFAYRLLNKRDAAEDVTHEVMMVLIEDPTRYRAEAGSLLTFLCAIARNQAFLYLRRCGRESETLSDDECQTRLYDEATLDPLDVLINRELAERVKEAIGALPLLQREVIILREYQELSYEEIARVVGASVGVVKARLHRGRQSLAKLLAPYLSSSGERCYELQ